MRLQEAAACPSSLDEFSSTQTQPFKIPASHHQLSFQPSPPLLRVRLGLNFDLYSYLRRTRGQYLAHHTIQSISFKALSALSE